MQYVFSMTSTHCYSWATFPDASLVSCDFMVGKLLVYLVPSTNYLLHMIWWLVRAGTWEDSCMDLDQGGYCIHLCVRDTNWYLCTCTYCMHRRDIVCGVCSAWCASVQKFPDWWLLLTARTYVCHAAHAQLTSDLPAVWWYSVYAIQRVLPECEHVQFTVGTAESDRKGQKWTVHKSENIKCCGQPFWNTVVVGDVV